MGERHSVLSRYVAKNEFQMCLKVKDVQPHRGKKKDQYTHHILLCSILIFLFSKDTKDPKPCILSSCVKDIADGQKCLKLQRFKV